VVTLCVKQSEMGNSFSANLAEIKLVLLKKIIQEKGLELKTIQKNYPLETVITKQNEDVNLGKITTPHTNLLNSGLLLLKSFSSYWVQNLKDVRLIVLTLLGITKPEMCGGRLVLNRQETDFLEGIGRVLKKIKVKW